MLVCLIWRVSLYDYLIVRVDHVDVWPESAAILMILAIAVVLFLHKRIAHAPFLMLSIML